MRGRIIGAVPIGERPAEVEGRLIPGHHEGDLIMGSKVSNTAVGTIVERSTGYLTLLPLPGGYDAASVADAIIEQHERPAILVHPDPDLGPRHRTRPDTNASPPPPASSVYFADPYSPWQRGSNENINGLLREYLPKGEPRWHIGVL